MLLKILQRFALRHVIRILLKVTKPDPILPVNVTKTFHAIRVRPTLKLGNVNVSAERFPAFSGLYRRATVPQPFSTRISHSQW